MNHEDIEHQYYVQTIKVNRGESVEAGQLMAQLADHCLLYIEGKAFEDDAHAWWRRLRTDRQFKLSQLLEITRQTKS